MPENYTCVKCGKVAKTKQALERHAAYHEDDRPFSCEVCLQRFKNTDDRGKHYRRLKRDGKFAFACRVCHKHFKSQELLAKHWEILGCLLKQMKATEAAGAESLPVVGGDIDQAIVLKEPIEELVLENDVKCSCKICEVEFIGTDNLKKHYKAVHKDTKRQVCIQCGQTLSSKDSLARHYSIFHQNNYPFQCELCDQKFKIKESLCRHVKFVHKDGGYPCEICKRVFSQPVNLKKHMAMHSNSLEFSCHICGREFRWKQAFQKHLLLHTTNSGNFNVKTDHTQDVGHFDPVYESIEVANDNVGSSSDNHQQTCSYNSIHSPPRRSDHHVAQLTQNQIPSSSNHHFMPSDRNTLKHTERLPDHLLWNKKIRNQKFELDDTVGDGMKAIISDTKNYKGPPVQFVTTDNKREVNKLQNSEASLNDLANIIVSYSKKENENGEAFDVDIVDHQELSALKSRNHNIRKVGGNLQDWTLDAMSESESPANGSTEVDNWNNINGAVDDLSDIVPSKLDSERENQILDKPQPSVSGKHKLKSDTMDVNMTLSWKKAKIYGKNLRYPLDDTVNNSVGKSGTVNSLKELKKKAMNSAKNELYFTSAPTNEEKDAPRYVFKPSSIQGILKDKCKASGSDFESAHVNSKEARADFKALLENTSNTPRKLSNPFLIPHSGENLESLTDYNHTIHEATNRVGVSSPVERKEKPVPKITGAYKFSLVKHMLSLKNEENFDKELFKNPLYSSPADLKGLTSIVARHKVEDGRNIYDLSARQSCPFQWIGVKVGKGIKVNSDSENNDTENSQESIEDLAATERDTKRNIDNTESDNSESESFDKEEEQRVDMERSRIKRDHRQIDTLDNHRHSIANEDCGVSTSGSFSSMVNYPVDFGQVHESNKSSDTRNRELANGIRTPATVSSTSDTNTAPIRSFQIMKDLVRCTKYARKVFNSDKDSEGIFKSILRNPFEIEENHFKDSKVNTESRNPYERGGGKVVEIPDECNELDSEMLDIAGNRLDMDSFMIVGSTSNRIAHKRHIKVPSKRVRSFSMGPGSSPSNPHSAIATSSSLETGQGFEFDLGVFAPTYSPSSNMNYGKQGSNNCSVAVSSKSNVIKSQGGMGQSMSQAGMGQSTSQAGMGQHTSQAGMGQTTSQAWMGHDTVHTSQSSQICSEDLVQGILVTSSRLATSVNGRLDSRMQSSNSLGVPVMLNHRGQGSKLTPEETEMTKTIAQELNEVLCSSLQNDIMTTKLTSQTACGAGNTVGNTSEVCTRTQARSVSNDSLYSNTSATMYQDGYHGNNDRGYAGQTIGVHEFNAGNGVSNNNTEVVRYSSSSGSDTALDLSDLNSHEFPDMSSNVNAKLRQSNIEASWSSTVMPSVSGQSVMSGSGSWSMECSRSQADHLVSSSNLQDKAGTDYSRKGFFSENNVQNREEISIFDLLKQGDKLKDFESIENLLDSCI